MRWAWIAFGLLGVAGSVQAEDTQGSGLALELNTLADAIGGCQVTFVISNAYQADIEHAVFETVLFDASGTVDRLTLFDFGALPAGRPRVRQFVIPDLACADLGQVLINGTHTCEAAELDDAACARGLTLSSRVAVEVIG